MEPGTPDNSEKAKLMQIMTPTGEAAFPWLFKPQPPMAGSASKEPSFQLMLVFDQGDERLAKLEAAILAVAVAKFGPKAGKMLQAGSLGSPLRSGDGRSEWMEGKMTMTARTTSRPDVVDRELEEITRPNDFYAGCRARMDVWLMAYDKAGNKGVSAILNNVQKMGDGERRSGARAAKDAFKDVEADEDEDEDDGM